MPPRLDRRVLLAEDNPINQKVAKLLLGKLGLQVDAVANGREALAAASSRHYDLIFMDCQMPEVDGYEATQELRRRQLPGRRSRIIAMTAHALPGDREKCLAAGMDDYISKPVTENALEAILMESFPADSSQAPPDQAASIATQSPAVQPQRQLADPEVPVAVQEVDDAAANFRLSEPPTEAGRPLSPPSVEGEPLTSASGSSQLSIAGLGNDFTARTGGAVGEAAKDPVELCDRATLDELRAEGDNLLPDLVRIFENELTKGIDELTEALAVRDCPTVARIAHTLKGTAGTFGAKQMHAMAATIDQAARAGHPDQCNVMLDDFRSECERVRSYLAAQVKA